MYGPSLTHEPFVNKLGFAKHILLCFTKEHKKSEDPIFFGNDLRKTNIGSIVKIYIKIKKESCL